MRSSRMFQQETARIQKAYYNLLNKSSIKWLVDLLVNPEDNGGMTTKGTAMTADREIAMYGMPVADIRSEYMESITARCSGLEMVVAGILSDCQELQAMGRSEAVRQQLNVAKFILFEMIDAKEQA